MSEEGRARVGDPPLSAVTSQPFAIQSSRSPATPFGVGKRARTATIACLSILIAGCADLPLRHEERPAPAEAKTDAPCVPEFSDRNGWYGGDTASSVALPASAGGPRSVWLFGDSFVEQTSLPRGRAYPMVRNTIGVSRCDRRTGWTWKPYWRRDAEHRPTAFFAPAPDDPWRAESRARTGRSPWYWPLAGFAYDGALFVGLLRVEHAPPRGPYRLPFRVTGLDLARIEEAHLPPADWSISILRLTHSSSFVPAAAFTVRGNHLYAFAFLDRNDGRRPRGLVRWPLSSLDPSSEEPPLSRLVETWERDGQWRRGLDPTRAAIVLSDDATEMSLHPADEGGWIAVDLPLSADRDTAPPTLVIRRADDLPGPWRVVQQIPVELPGPAQPGLGSFCYAGKAHPEIPASGSLWVTYVCSFFAAGPEEDGRVLRALREANEWYRPTGLLVPLHPDPSTRR